MERQIIVSGIPEAITGAILAFGDTLRYYLRVANCELVSQSVSHIGDGTVDWIYTYRVKIEGPPKKVTMRMR